MAKVLAVMKATGAPMTALGIAHLTGWGLAVAGVVVLAALAVRYHLGLRRTKAELVQVEADAKATVIRSEAEAELMRARAARIRAVSRSPVPKARSLRMVHEHHRDDRETG